MNKILIAALLTVSGGCFAEVDVTSGNYFHQLCSRDKSGCVYFVSGVVKGAEVAVASLTPAKSAMDVHRKLNFCTSDEVTYGQYADVFTKFLDANPEVRHMPAVNLAFMSWMQAWPCK